MEEEKNKRKKKKGMKVFKIVLLVFLAIFLLTGVAGAGVAFAMIKSAPPLDVNQVLTLNEPSTLLDNNDQFMDDVASSEKRDIVTIKDVPKYLVDGIVSIEDERFYSHSGIDLQRIAGVVYIDIKKVLTGSGSVQGASTITQQLIRNTMGLTRKADIKRKIQEMYLAVELEKRLHKDQILEAYMNTIPLGGTIYGVEAAARAYFNKKASELNLMQCAYIAGLTQSPDVYSAFTKTGKTKPNLYLERTKNVLMMMYKNDKITKEEYEKTVSELSTEKLGFNLTVATQSSRLNYEWFSLPVIEQVKKDLKEQYNYTEDEINTLLMNGGLRIHTTMDRTLQDESQKIINDNKNYGVASKPDEKGIIQPQASAVIMDYHTGEVKVIIGGRGEQPARSYNRAAYNGSKGFVKPVGSSIKPLTVYSAAIDSKKATAGTVVEDSPLPVEIGKQWPEGGKPWNPNNSETGLFRGYVTLRQAIKESINLVAIKEEYNIGLKTGISYGEKYGLTFDPKYDETSLSAISLGELYDGENTLTMAAAYGTFGNGGMYTQPILYKKVVDRRGVTILETKTTNKKILSPQSAYIMYDLLKGPTSAGGTAPSARFGSMPVSGKTGTSSKKKELWFSGLTPYLSGAVWIGHDTPESFPKGISSSTAGSLWGKLMKVAHKDLEVTEIERPSNIREVAICRDSGLIPTDLCSKDPRGSRVYTELFIDGTQPTALCDVHVEARINKETKKLATDLTPPDKIETRVFIKRDYVPEVLLEDQAYVLPLEMDDALPAPSPSDGTPGTTEETPENNNGKPGTKNPTEKPETPSPENENTTNTTTKKP